MIERVQSQAPSLIWTGPPPPDSLRASPNRVGSWLPVRIITSWPEKASFSIVTLWMQSIIASIWTDGSMSGATPVSALVNLTTASR
jgi:hypothetical protein